MTLFVTPILRRRNLQPKSSSEIFIRAVLAVVVVVSIKLVGPNTAVFGTIICIQKAKSKAKGKDSRLFRFVKKDGAK